MGERSFDHVGFELRGAVVVDAFRLQCRPPAVTAAPRANLTVVVIPSLTSALSLSRSDLVVILEGHERHERVYPSMVPAYPVRLAFDGIAPGNPERPDGESIFAYSTQRQGIDHDLAGPARVSFWRRVYLPGDLNSSPSFMIHDV